MAIRHKFTSAKADGADATLVRPSNWNDSHEIDDNTIGVSKLLDGTAGELITWDALGVADTIAAGTSGYVLTAQGPGATPTWQAPGGVADGDKGDIVVSGVGTVWTIEGGAVTYSKIQNVSAGDKLLGRITGAGVIEEIACTAAGRALLDDVSNVAQRATLGLVIGTDVQAYSSVLANTTASFTTADETKLDGIEALADVTDEANVTSALSGATPGTVTVSGTDLVFVQDASDSNNLKLVTAQSIGNLGGGGGLTIGAAVSGGSPNRILFEDGSTQLADSANLTWNGTVLGITGNLTVTDEAYGGTWDASLQVPTKNAVYDKIEAIGTSSYLDGGMSDSLYGGTTPIDGGNATT